MTEAAPGRDDLVVLKCETCGDVFPTDEEVDARCPSCGGAQVQRAHEPLL